MSKDKIDFTAVVQEEELNLTPEEKEAIDSLNQIVDYPKGAILLRDGEYSGKCFYIREGCVRQYTLKEGEEKTSFFYTEGHSINSVSSYLEKRASDYYLECVEDCTLLITNVKDEYAFVQRFPRFEQMCRLTTEKSLHSMQSLFALYMSSTPEERYLHLLESRPDLPNRVPQYQLASYLGVKPESLSRIRKRLSQKK